MQNYPYNTFFKSEEMPAALYSNTPSVLDYTWSALKWFKPEEINSMTAAEYA